MGYGLLMWFCITEWILDNLWHTDYGPAIQILWTIWNTAEPITTKMKSAISSGDTGYCSSFFDDLLTFPRLVMFLEFFSVAFFILGVAGILFYFFRLRSRINILQNDLNLDYYYGIHVVRRSIRLLLNVLVQTSCLAYSAIWKCTTHLLMTLVWCSVT